MAEPTMNTTSEQPASRREDTRSLDQYVRPPVDILENEEGLTLVADLPGVDRQHLSISIEDNVLTIQGEASPRDGAREVYREFSLMNYYRQFQLPELIDQSKTTAALQNGVLTLKLFKAEKAKPRRIEIQTV